MPKTTLIKRTTIWEFPNEFVETVDELEANPAPDDDLDEDLDDDLDEDPDEDPDEDDDMGE
jgi:hypothetical protein